MLWLLPSAHVGPLAAALAAYLIIVLACYGWHAWRGETRAPFDLSGRFARPGPLPAPPPQVARLALALSPALLFKGTGIVGPALLAEALLAPAAQAPQPGDAGWARALAQIALLWLLRDFASYLQHRAQHRAQIFWRFHAAHHSVERLSPLSQLVGHPLDLLVAAFITFAMVFPGAVLAALLGNGAMASALWVFLPCIIAFEHAKGALGHSHLPLDFRGWNRLILSPAMHQLHHSAEPRHRDVNFGSTFGLWDWMFGTLRMPAAGDDYRLGLDERSLGAANPFRSARAIYLLPVETLPAETLPAENLPAENLPAETRAALTPPRRSARISRR